MGSHADANEEGRALSQFAPCFPSGGHQLVVGRPEGLGKGAESRAHTGSGGT